MAEEDLRNELIEFQNLQQQLQLVAMQKQQLLVNAQEVQRALEEVGKASEKQSIYRLIGNVFIPKTAAGIKKELEEEKEALELRKGTVAKQEQKFTERLNAIRKKVEVQQAKEGARING